MSFLSFSIILLGNKLLKSKKKKNNDNIRRAVKIMRS